MYRKLEKLVGDMKIFYEPSWLGNGVQTFSQTLFIVCLWEGFWMRLTSELVYWIKHIALPYCPYVGGSHLIILSPEYEQNGGALTAFGIEGQWGLNAGAA